MKIIFRIDNGTASSSRRRSREAPRPLKFTFFFVIGLAFLVFLGSILGDGGLMRVYQLSQDKKDLQARIALEEARQQQLLARIKTLKEDPLELERVAREELGLVKKGEIIFDFRETGPRN
jgi:cell division protein FtsB